MAVEADPGLNGITKLGQTDVAGHFTLGHYIPYAWPKCALVNYSLSCPGSLKRQGGGRGWMRKQSRTHHQLEPSGERGQDA
jgi:hypothetical protein